MMGDAGDEGYSGRTAPMYPYYGGMGAARSSRGGNSYGPGRGRGSDAERDSMGRYSGDGYSYGDMDPMMRR